VEVTTLGSSTLNGKERCHRLAEFLDKMTRPVLRKYPIVFYFNEADLDTFLMEVRQQKNLIDGLSKTQPWVDELSRVADMVFDQVNDDLDNVALYMVGKIDSANAEFVMYHKLMQQLQNLSFQCLVHLGEYRRGDPAGLEKMYALDPTLKNLAKSDKTLTTKEMQAIEDRLLFKIEKARDFKEQLAPDLEIYKNQQKELDDLYLNAKRQLRKARITVIVWSRTHRDLAQGIVDPAKINIFDLTKKAIDTAL
jgi:hypothetical protein